MPSNNYTIWIGNELIGYAKDLEDDMPWRKGRFAPAESFEKYRLLFDVSIRLGAKKDWENRDDLLDAIYRLGLRIETPQGELWIPCIGTDLKPGGFTFFQIRGETVAWRPS